MDLDELFEQAEGAIILDGFNEAIIGLVEEFGNGPRNPVMLYQTLN